MRRIIRGLLLAGLLSLGLIAMAATAASAQTGGTESVTVFTLGATVTAFIVGTLLPVLVGIVTKLQSPEWVKAWLHALLSAVAGAFVVAVKLDGTAVFSKETILAAAGVWIVGIAVYHGFLKPTKISPVINQKTAALGI